MIQQIQIAIELSNKQSRLLKAKQEVGEALYVHIRGDIFLEAPLEEFLTRIEVKIQTKRSEINRIIETIPGYRIEQHNKVDFISKSEINEGYIELLSADDRTTKLYLETGEIVSIPNRPQK